jgi:hypothetical protein
MIREQDGRTAGQPAHLIPSIDTFLVPPPDDVPAAIMGESIDSTTKYP